MRQNLVIENKDPKLDYSWAKEENIEKLKEQGFKKTKDILHELTLMIRPKKVIKEVVEKKKAEVKKEEKPKEVVKEVVKRNNKGQFVAKKKVNKKK